MGAPPPGTRKEEGMPATVQKEGDKWRVVEAKDTRSEALVQARAINAHARRGD